MSFDTCVLRAQRKAVSTTNDRNAWCLGLTADLHSRTFCFLYLSLVVSTLNGAEMKTDFNSTRRVKHRIIDALIVRSERAL